MHPRLTDQRGATIDRELCLAIQNYEHLFALIVKVLADTTVRHDHATMEENQIWFHSVGAQHDPEIHGSRSVMHGGEMLIFLVIGTGYTMFDVTRRGSCALRIGKSWAQ